MQNPKVMIIKENHYFLFGKWWFRLIVVLYPIAVLSFLLWYFTDQISIYTACYSNISVFYDYGSQLYNSAFEECKERVYEALLPSIGIAVLMTLVIHYLIQFVSFKAIFYIIYGKKK